MSDTKNPITPAIFDQARDAVSLELAQSFTIGRPGNNYRPSMGNTNNRGSYALIYTAWPGKGCGTVHNFGNIQAAAARMHIPLYKINSYPEQGSISDKPGQERFGDIGNYDLLNEDRGVVLLYNNRPIGKVGSSQGDIVGRLAPLMQREQQPSRAGGRSW